MGKGGGPGRRKGSLEIRGSDFWEVAGNAPRCLKRPRSFGRTPEPSHSRFGSPEREEINNDHRIGRGRAPKGEKKQQQGKMGRSLGSAYKEGNGEFVLFLSRGEPKRGVQNGSERNVRKGNGAEEKKKGGLSNTFNKLKEGLRMVHQKTKHLHINHMSR